MIKDVVKKYSDKIKYIYKHFPVHGEIDVRLAELVEAAGAQGKFWEYLDKLMSVETIQAVIKNYEAGEINKEKAISIAQELGLDIAKFEEAIDKRIYKDKINEHKQIVQKIFEDAIKKFNADPYELGPYTPLLFINGKEYKGARSIEAFSQIIEEELKKENK